MKRYPSKEARELILIAKELGWHPAGYSGTGHPRLIHENGAKITIAATPGDRRNRANSLAMLERLSGRKLDRQNRRAS
jgi:hypothetical protein